MASAAIERVKFPWSKQKRSSSEPPVDGAGAGEPEPSVSGVSEASEGGGPAHPEFHTARSISEEVVSRPHEPTLPERWTDSIRRGRDRLRRRFSQRGAEESQSPRPAGDALEPEDGDAEPKQRKSRREAFLQPVKRFGRVAKRSAVGKPVVRFARTCKRDVPKPYLYLRAKISSISPPARLRSESPGPRSLSPPDGSGSNQDADEIVFALGYPKEQEEHIYDPVGEPVVQEPPEPVERPDPAEDEFARFSRFAKSEDSDDGGPEPEYPVPEVVETERCSRTPEPCIKDTSRPGSRASRQEDFPKSVRFGKKRTSEDSVGVRFKPLSTSSSKEAELGSCPGLQRVRTQLKDDAAGLNLVSKFVEPRADAVDLPPIEIRQLEEPPRVLRPRSRDTPDTADSVQGGDKTPVFEACEQASKIQAQPLPPPPAAKETIPSKIYTPPVKAQTPPRRAQTPPKRVQTPPPKVAPAVVKPQTEEGALVSQIISEKLSTAKSPSAPVVQAPQQQRAVACPDIVPTQNVEPIAKPQVAVHTQPPPVFEAPPPPVFEAPPPPAEPPSITLTADCRPPRPPPPSAETLQRRKPLQQVDINVQSKANDQLQPVESVQKTDTEPRPPYQAKIRAYWEERRAHTLKPPRKRKRADAENAPRSQSADKPAGNSRRTIDIFGTGARRGRRTPRVPTQSGGVPAPPRPPPPAPRRPPRSRSGGAAVSLQDVRDINYVDESATEESQDYGDGRSYRRLLDDDDAGPYRPSRGARRPQLDAETAVTSTLVVNLRPETEQEPVALRTTAECTQPAAEEPPLKPPRSSRIVVDSHNSTFESVVSEGPRSLHSFQQEELGSGDELMLIVNDRDGRTELAKAESDTSKPSPSQVEPAAEVQLRPTGKPEYAHVRKRSSLLQREEPAYDYPPPVPKKLSELASASAAPVVAPPRRRPASLSPRRQQDTSATWPKRRHKAHRSAPPQPPQPPQPAEAAVSPPPRTVRRSQVRSSTVPRWYRSAKQQKQTLYHLAKQHSQDDSVDMKNRPLPPPPPPPRKRPSGGKSELCLGSLEAPASPDIFYHHSAITPLEQQIQSTVPSSEQPPVIPVHTEAEPAAAVISTNLVHTENPPAAVADPLAGVSPAVSDIDLSSQATDAPSEITLRSEGSDSTLNASRISRDSGPDPGCESSDDQFFSMTSEPPAKQDTPVKPKRREAPLVTIPSAQLSAAAPRHVLIPHFIERVSTSEMDAASAHVVDLTACRIKVTELEVDRIYIREGKVKLLTREEGSDDDTAAGGAGGRALGDGESRAGGASHNASAPPAALEGPSGSGGDRAGHQAAVIELAPEPAEPTVRAAARQQSPPVPTVVISSTAGTQTVRQQSSSDDSSESRPLDPALATELERVQDSFRQLGSCLTRLQSPPPPPDDAAAGGGGDSAARGDDARHAGSTELSDIRAALQTVITPERAAARRTAAQLCRDGGAVRDAAADSDAASRTSDVTGSAGSPDGDGDSVDAPNPGRRPRLSQLFSSLGKGLRRRHRRPHSQFYVELDRSDSESGGSSAGPSGSATPSEPELEMGSGGSAPARQVVTGGGALGQERLQYARVIEEFSSNVASLCQEVADDAPPDAASQRDTSASEALVTAPELSDSEADTLHTATGDLPAPAAPPPPPAPPSKAYLVAREMVTSEQAFVDTLRLLNVDFRAAAAAAGDLPAAELDTMLRHLPELQQLNEELLHDLHDRLSGWAARPVIADVIVRKGPFLKLYSAYIRDFQSQCRFLADCRRIYPAFCAACAQFEASPRCRGLSVAHFLLRPVQRLPQYRLLLEDYLRHQTADMDDYDNTRAALEIVCEVAEHANSSMREGDNFRQLLQLQERLRWAEIVKPGRSLLCQGELMKLCRKAPQPRFVILLSDCLLLTRFSGSTGVGTGPLTLDYAIPLTGMKVTVPVGTADEYQTEFSVVSTTRSFSLTASSNKERDDWVNALLGAIEKNASNRATFNGEPGGGAAVDDGTKLGEKAPVWVPDNRASMCQLCTTEFTVTTRRHHCRACGKVVCGACSNGKAPLVYQQNTPARVCDVCFDTLQKDVEDHKIDSHNNSQTKKTAAGTLGRRTHRKVPKRLEVSAGLSGCQMRGCLQRRARKQWKRAWFVLRDRVLYMYRASQDVVAVDSLPVLGYRLQTLAASPVKSYEGVDADLVFQLTHPNRPPLVFHADTPAQAQQWMSSLQSATVLT